MTKRRDAALRNLGAFDGFAEVNERIKVLAVEHRIAGLNAEYMRALQDVINELSTLLEERKKNEQARECVVETPSAVNFAKATEAAVNLLEGYPEGSYAAVVSQALLASNALRTELMDALRPFIDFLARYEVNGGKVMSPSIRDFQAARAAFLKAEDSGGKND